MEQKSSSQLTKRQDSLMKIKFLLFSISAGVIQILSFTVLNEFIHLDQYTSIDELLGSDYGLSYFIALILSVLWNFTFNRKFTFKSAANVPLAMAKVFGYYCVFTPLSIWWGTTLAVRGWNEYIILMGTMLINLVSEFLFCRFVVYRDTIYTNDAGKKELAEIGEQKPS